METVATEIPISPTTWEAMSQLVINPANRRMLSPPCETCSGQIELVTYYIYKEQKLFQIRNNENIIFK